MKGNAWDLACKLIIYLQCTFSSSEQESQSVSQVLKEVNQDQLSTLKQNAKDCLNLLGPTKLLDSEQLAVYPDTKWQLERKQNKVCICLGGGSVG